MSVARTYKAWVWQGKGATLTARVENLSGVLITQASLTSITRKVFDADDNHAEILSGTLTIASVVFDTLRSGAEDLKVWTDQGQLIDRVGWNFRDSIPASAFPLGKFQNREYRRYVVEYSFDPASGDDFLIQLLAYARNVHGTAG